MHKNASKKSWNELGSLAWWNCSGLGKVFTPLLHHETGPVLLINHENKQCTLWTPTFQACCYFDIMMWILNCQVTSCYFLGGMQKLDVPYTPSSHQLWSATKYRWHDCAVTVQMRSKMKCSPLLSSSLEWWNSHKIIPPLLHWWWLRNDMGCLQLVSCWLLQLCNLIDGTMCYFWRNPHLFGWAEDVVT